MKKLALILSALLFFTSSLSYACTEHEAAIKDLEMELAQLETKAGQFPEIGEWVKRAETCHHFTGEEPYNEERGIFIKQQFAENSCDRLSCDYESLKSNLADNTAALEELHSAKNKYMVQSSASCN